MSIKRNQRSIFYFSPFLVLGICSMLTTSCKKEDDNVTIETSLPVLTTSIISDRTETSAISGGTVISDGGSAVTARGVCWSVDSLPTVNDNKIEDSSGTVTFKSTIPDLTANTTYYVRAYAKNSKGIGYGNSIEFSTYGTVIDHEGNSYKTIKIGTQVWMAENLKVTKYQNGDLIGTTTLATLSIGAENYPKYQWAYDGDENNVHAYGRLYTWYAVTDTRGVCPVGWHLPTDSEWTSLTEYLGEHPGIKLKETDTLYWRNPNNYATNESGFSARPGGHRRETGSYSTKGSEGKWWTSSTYDNNDFVAYKRRMIVDGKYVSRETESKYFGNSVRCVKD